MIQAGDITGLLVAVVLISLVPFVAMVVTSYAKIVVVLGLLRNALGVQQVPPNMVINGIAILVSIYVMAPVGMSAMRDVESKPSGNASEAVIQILGNAREPFREFLAKHAATREKRFFLRSASIVWPKEAAATLQENDLIVLAPAFALTQLTDAFKIGFLLYIAFIVIDLVIANVLLAMGLNQVNPTNVAIPFKLLLFVVVDGWSTLIHGLLVSFR
ncbi:EscR/YscR/HrcR family type III secretion system export apparatus protein [Burkholderia ubonensis]|uniref:type III secretion system export apparatus subunit SctR n=1 Tax=Burkholderia ubonensis TaxID=101571 RepID=UPI0008FDE3E2|nr:type III secretion system export apparatus subunit SctR [Burkholderia ubonensis]OJA31035.1 EscR/YscR/HrcR family type III secretion system export apparatus protein [Burkholderia ubonensis]OJB28180.1 EscR/YscR/HrcR family type III secretion system export apparatus protein [Burkholderia ubonensis]